jgi:hypothetical protein
MAKNTFNLPLQKENVVLKPFGELQISVLQDKFSLPYLRELYGKNCLKEIIITKPHKMPEKEKEVDLHNRKFELVKDLAFKLRK